MGMIQEAEQSGRRDFLCGVRYDANRYDKKKQFSEYMAWKVGYRKEERDYQLRMGDVKC